MSTSASTSRAQPHPATTATAEKSPFERQREALVSEIAVSLEHVLQNINKLNRSLEGVIAVGNEFGSVEALWSQFEGVMAKEEGVEEGRDGGEGDGGDEYGEEEGGEEEEEGEGDEGEGDEEQEDGKAEDRRR